jgi:hypothetical protein
MSVGMKVNLTLKPEYYTTLSTVALASGGSHLLLELKLPVVSSFQKVLSL